MIASKVRYSVGILAGGKSSRMGKNKALLEYESKTFISRIIEQFEGQEIILSEAYDNEYDIPGIKTVTDENEDIGPIEGIRQILKASTNEYVFICACDMPFITSKIADYLSEFISSDYDCYVITDEDRMHPLCAIYSKKIIPVIEELIARKDYKLRLILDNTRTKLIGLENTNFDKKTVRNVNTKEEYNELKLPVIFAVSGFKDSGKTWLIVELINEFIKDGFTVGVIKHDGHDSIAETEGTDTYKYGNAGAKITAVYSDSKYVISSGEKTDSEVLINYMKNMENTPDIIILEGFKHSSYPKVILEKEGEEFPYGEHTNAIVKIAGRCDRDKVAFIYDQVKKKFDL